MIRRSVLACAALTAVLVGTALSQMSGTGRRSVPGRPLPAGMVAPEVRFEDLAEKAGLSGIDVSGSDQQQSYIIENTGNGVAIFDYDNDGLPDIFVVNGDRFDRTGPPPTHFLYHNLGGLRFEDTTAKAGIAHTDWGQGACAGDVDNDGNIDLFVTSWGRNVLWRNQGKGAFKDETSERGLSGPKRWSTGCAFLDYDRDGSLDLFVAHYLDFDPAKTAKPGDKNQCVWKGFAVVCGPMGLPPETMSLYHNDGTGRFTDVSAKSGIGAARAAGLSVLTGDFDNDGWPDIYVAGDSTPSLHFLNLRNGRFEEIGAFSGVAYNEDGHEQSGMGVSAGDYDHDGALDIVKTNFIEDTPNLYHNQGDGTFSEVTAAAGLAAHTQFVSWGVGFLDFDNDGWKDILVVNGHVYPDIDRRNVGQTFREPRLLYWNRRDRQFYDLSSKAGSGIQSMHSSRGMAVADLDNDGMVEIVVVNMHEHPSLLKNFAASGNSILVRALTSSGRDAPGARLSVSSGGQTQTDEVRSGGYYISSGDFRVHFGLGTAQTAQLKIRWPDGSSAEFADLPANHLIVVQQGRGVILKQKLAARQP